MKEDELFENKEEKYLELIIRDSVTMCESLHGSGYDSKHMALLLRQKRRMAKNFINEEYPCRSSFLAMQAEKLIEEAMSYIKLMHHGQKAGIKEIEIVSLFQKFRHNLAEFSVMMMKMRDAYRREKGFSFTSETDSMKRTVEALRDDFPWLASKLNNTVDNDIFRKMFVKLLEEQGAK